jgi:hypothetical protein
MIMPAKRRLWGVALVLLFFALIGILYIRPAFLRGGRGMVVSQHGKKELQHRSTRLTGELDSQAGGSPGVMLTDPDQSFVRNRDPLLAKIIAMRSRLGLTDEQIAPIADCLEKLSEDRLSYERQIATATPVSSSEVLIQIPAYPQQGAAILQAFDDAITKEIGADHASALKRFLSQDINLANDSLGSKAQEIRVTRREIGWFGFDHKIYSQDDPNGFASRIHNDRQVDDLGKYRLLQSLFKNIKP